jgi:Tfp pilus assembly protein PilN
MRAVNLIPAEERVSGRGIGIKLSPPTTALFGLLAAAIVLVTLYVLADNTVASRQGELASARLQLTRVQAEASGLQKYTQFATLAATRVQTVRTIAGTRFDWNSALENLARVVPANTSLQSLDGSVVPGASAGSGSGGSGGGGASGLRGALQGPAFNLTGCTGSQDDVAGLVSRLRTMPGVERVALASSQISANASAQGSGCAAHKANFALVVFYKTVAGAGAQGATTGGPSTSATGGATTGAGGGATTGAAGGAPATGATPTATTTTTPAGGSQ